MATKVMIKEHCSITDEGACINDDGTFSQATFNQSILIIKNIVNTQEPVVPQQLKRISLRCEISKFIQMAFVLNFLSFLSFDHRNSVVIKTQLHLINEINLISSFQKPYDKS